MRDFVPGRFTACPGTDFASFFTGEITGVEYIGVHSQGCINKNDYHIRGVLKKCSTFD